MPRRAGSEDDSECFRAIWAEDKPAAVANLAFRRPLATCGGDCFRDRHVARRMPSALFRERVLQFPNEPDERRGLVDRRLVDPFGSAEGITALHGEIREPAHKIVPY